jgi:predicted nucleic acid-binding protein
MVIDRREGPSGPLPEHASRRGRQAGTDAGQIAAIALTNGLVLVTANVADFRDVPGLDVADWRA